MQGHAYQCWSKNGAFRVVKITLIVLVMTVMMVCQELKVRASFELNRKEIPTCIACCFFRVKFCYKPNEREMIIGSVVSMFTVGKFQFY